MSLIPLEELLKKVDNRYELVNLVAKRAIQLLDGTTPLIDEAEGERVNTIAIKELRENKIVRQQKIPEKSPA
ncbi:MAG: DNA-directed RNA polymerase subunit omega [bacterium]